MNNKKSLLGSLLFIIGMIAFVLSFLIGARGMIPAFHLVSILSGLLIISGIIVLYIYTDFFKKRRNYFIILAISTVVFVLNIYSEDSIKLSSVFTHAIGAFILPTLLFWRAFRRSSTNKIA